MGPIASSGIGLMLTAAFGPTATLLFDVLRPRDGSEALVTTMLSAANALATGQNKENLTELMKELMPARRVEPKYVPSVPAWVLTRYATQITAPMPESKLPEAH